MATYSGWPPVILTELPPSLRVILGMGVWVSPEGDMEGVPPDTPILIFSLVWPGVPPAWARVRDTPQGAGLVV